MSENNDIYYASFLRRLSAFIIDSSILTVVIIAIKAYINVEDNYLQNFYFHISLCLLILYFPFFECFF